MLNGLKGSPGYAIGTAKIIREQLPVRTVRAESTPDTELARYRIAVERFCRITEKSAEKIRETVGESEAQIISGHIFMLKDPYMNGEIEKLILSGSVSESAVSYMCDMFAEQFMASENELIRLRATDLNDIKQTMISILSDNNELSAANLPENTILIAEDLTPSMMADIEGTGVTGVVSQTGGVTSHCAILARAMQIPVVLSAENVISEAADGDTVIIDGCNGCVIVKPDNKQLEIYRDRLARYEEEKQALKEYADKPTTTADGKAFMLGANIIEPEEARTAAKYSCDCIGLFRSEFLYMDRQFPPSENEQFSAYKKTAVLMKGKTVIIRTLDVGGDKKPPCIKLSDSNAGGVLGLRGIRFSLANKELFAVQLRAIVRASAFGDIRILLPLVTNVEEIRKVRKMLAEIFEDYRHKGIDFDENIKLGVMIETPAACFTADILSKEADFFSIGTNDLTQYIMAADRTVSEVSYLYSHFQPAVLTAIKYAISSAKKAGIPVGVCGEAASDTDMIPLLIGFGADEISASSASVLTARKTISRWTVEKAREYAEEYMLNIFR